ncbi:hypothetical protein K8O92_27330 [Nocardia asteroides]|nr:hypothetical protein K8O92_27330 [Nocardia asteroides]
MTIALPTLTVCSKGHTVNYPADLEDTAASTQTDLGFCVTCPCGVVTFAIAWAGDRIRIQEQGDLSLYSEFEATGWPESDLGDPRIGSFLCRTVPPLGAAAFAKQSKHGR